MSTIKSSTTTTTAYSVTADTTGTLVIQTGATPTTAVTIGSDQSVTFAGTVSLSGNQTTTGNLTVNGNTTLGDASTDTILMTGAPSIGGAGYGMGFGFRNRIINGAMVIDQRNAGASVTATVTSARTYVLDRWGYFTTQASKFTVQQNAGSVTPPAGFRNYIGITSSSAYTPVASDIILLQQPIEGYNVYDLNFGSASASTITFSFWVRSSLTGTFAGSLGNSANSRLYPFTFTISSANTWEQKTITVTGDTSGTWVTDNGIGLYLNFNLGTGSTYLGTAGAWTGSAFYSATGGTNIVATNGATFYITGVQLEKGSTATSFDYRPYGTELALCQRYYESTAYPDASFGLVATRVTTSTSTTTFAGGFSYLVPKRTNSPTVTVYSRNNNSGKASLVATGADIGGISAANNIGGTGFWGLALGTAQATGTGIEYGWTASAEL